MVTKENIIDLLSKHGFNTFAFNIIIGSEVVKINSQTHVFTFDKICKSLSILCNGNLFVRRKTFDARSFERWRQFNKVAQSSNENNKKAANGVCKESLGLRPSEYKNFYWPFFSDMFDLIESESLELISEGVNLVPINIDQFIIDYKDQNWYKKLLQEYTEYYQSGSKSDIADRHYQEQARLHGLKFVMK